MIFNGSSGQKKKKEFKDRTIKKKVKIAFEWNEMLLILYLTFVYYFWKVNGKIYYC